MAEDKKVGFVSMASDSKTISDIPEVGMGMIGHAFMGKAHSNAWKQMPYRGWLQECSDLRFSDRVFRDR